MVKRRLCRNLCLVAGMATLLSVTVDGKPLARWEIPRVKSEVFEVSIPANGFLDPSVYSPAVDDGFYVMLKPQKLGSHTLRVIAARNGCSFTPDPFSLDVTYQLNVVPVSLK